MDACHINSIARYCKKTNLFLMSIDIFEGNQNINDMESADTPGHFFLHGKGSVLNKL